MVWKKHTRTTKPIFNAINFKWDFTLQIQLKSENSCVWLRVSAERRNYWHVQNWIFPEELWEAIRQRLSYSIFVTVINRLSASLQHTTLNRHCNFSTITQFIRNFKEKWTIYT